MPPTLIEPPENSPQTPVLPLTRNIHLANNHPKVAQVSLQKSAPEFAFQILPNHWFLKKINGCLEKHLADSDLTVGNLLNEIGLSRTSLHRKLIELTGMSTTAYVRYFRLHKAAELISNSPEKNMFEIAVSVGFDNQSYFTKKFKQVFGCCPSHYWESIIGKDKVETCVLKLEHT